MCDTYLDETFFEEDDSQALNNELELQEQMEFHSIKRLVESISKICTIWRKDHDNHKKSIDEKKKLSWKQ
jgi:hypothetical protein